MNNHEFDCLCYEVTKRVENNIAQQQSSNKLLFDKMNPKHLFGQGFNPDIITKQDSDPNDAVKVVN